MSENDKPKGPGALQAKYPFHKRFVRKPVQIRVEVERFSEAQASSSVNISPSGLCFLLQESLEQDEEMRILLYIPRGKEVEILKVKARMVWQEQRDEDEGQFRIGAKFEQFAPGDERRLRSWLIDLQS